MCEAVLFTVRLPSGVFFIESDIHQWRTEGGLGLNPPALEISKISVESSIAWERRIGVSISFCTSLYSHTVVIY